jgi:hypothetical protein
LAVRVEDPEQARERPLDSALAAGSGVREVLDHSRHADIRTLMLYDDRRRDDGGKIAALVADALG